MEAMIEKWNVYLEWCKYSYYGERDPYDMDNLAEFEKGGAVYKDEFGDLFLENEVDIYHCDVMDGLYDSNDTDSPRMRYELLWS